MVLILDGTLSGIIIYLYSGSILEIKPEDFVIFRDKTEYFFHCIYREQSKSCWLTYLQSISAKYYQILERSDSSTWITGGAVCGALWFYVATVTTIWSI